MFGCKSAICIEGLGKSQHTKDMMAKENQKEEDSKWGSSFKPGAGCLRDQGCIMKYIQLCEQVRPMATLHCLIYLQIDPSS
jgi:hypothetical protein